MRAVRASTLTFIEETDLTGSSIWLRWGIIGAVFLAGVGLVASWWAVRPAPPRSIVFTAGSEGGAYLEFAQRYAQILARDGVRVEVRTSEGSIENLQRLRRPSADPQAADVGFIQSGVVPSDERAGLIALGRLYYEPSWLFVRRSLGDVTLVALEGKRINIGPQGSGTRALAMAVLRAANVDPASLQLLDLDVTAAAAALRAGSIDAVLFVAKADAPVVRELLAAPEVLAVSWPRADALQRRLPEVRKVVVPAGVVDFRRPEPERDVTTLAALATLVARDDLHPAIAFLLVRAAREIHGGPGLLHSAGDFPTIQGLTEFDVPEDVARLYAGGPPFLYRVLPFWLANLLMRLWVLAIPLAAVAAVASDWLPRLLMLPAQMRVQKLYRRVKELEARAVKAVVLARGKEELLAEIEALGTQIDAQRAPVTMLKTHYDLRRQLNLLREDLAAAAARLRNEAPRASTADHD